jgi:hypothetical protein
MEDADLTDGNLLSDEMKINLHMLRVLMLNGVGGEVHGADVVAVDLRRHDRRRTSPSGGCSAQHPPAGEHRPRLLLHQLRQLA